MKLIRRAQTEPDHQEVEKRLDEHERKLGEQAKRLRRLEIEVGIFKPPLRRAGS